MTLEHQKAPNTNILSLWTGFRWNQTSVSREMKLSWHKLCSHSCHYPSKSHGTEAKRSGGEKLILNCVSLRFGQKLPELFKASVQATRAKNRPLPNRVKEDSSQEITFRHLIVSLLSLKETSRTGCCFGRFRKCLCSVQHKLLCNSSAGQQKHTHRKGLVFLLG